MRTEYWIEGALLGLFMISACAFAVLLEHPASPARQAVESGLARRAVAGAAMGLTAAALIYSPWGKRSGAHMNPAVTLAFWRLGKIPGRHALAYALAQSLGGLAGVLFCAAMFGPYLKNSAVAYAVTRPGAWGTSGAWWGEFLISFLLLSVVLAMMGSKRSAWTGVAAAFLIALYITLEAPLSGMSMNPARTLASAWPAGIWNGFWIYLTAPPMAMLAAAELYRASAIARGISKGSGLDRRSLGEGGCAKLIHDLNYRCLFCGYDPGGQPS